MKGQDDPHSTQLLAAGDYVSGGAVGALTAIAVRAVVGPDWDMVLAMLVGMGIGMLVHLAVGALLAPMLGMFHVMVPGALIGMYGGMLFAMRDTMQHPWGSMGNAILVGFVFGLIVTGAIRLYDRALRGPIATNGRGS
jgi:hypothetical protein